jgi:hypothetical protein
MTQSIASFAVANRSARAAKCDRDVKLHVPESLYDDLTLLARMDQRPVSEYIRVTLDRHVYGALGAQRG